MNNRSKHDFRHTTNSRVYNRLLKRERELKGEIHCGWCAYHKSDNARHTDLRNWKRYRAHQYRE
jgi:hypothetical protein